MRKKEVIVIDAPVAYTGDSVEVENYRCKPAVLEVGEVLSLKYEHLWGVWRWQYTVGIDRPNGGYRLYVGDASIRRIN